MKRWNLAFLFYFVAGSYATLYVIMFFVPSFHDFHASFLIFGVFLLIGFIIFRSWGEYSRLFRIGAFVLLGSLLFQFFVEITGFHQQLYAIEIIHFGVHLLFGLTYFVFTLGIFKETANYRKNRKLRQAIFDYNEAIIFEFKRKQQEIHIEFSNKMMRHYHLKVKNYRLSIAKFQSWILPQDFPKFRCLHDEQAIMPMNTVFHMKVEQKEPLIAVQIKGTYELNRQVTCVGLDFTDIEGLEKHIASENQARLTLLENLQVGVMEVELLYDETNKAIDYRLLYLNQALAAIMNQEHSRLHLGLGSKLIPNQYKGRLRYFEQALNEQRTLTFEAFSELGNKWYNLTAYPTKNKTVIVIFQDINELVLLNTKLEYIASHNARNDFLN